MKCSLSPLDRLNLIAILPQKGGKYTQAMSDEIDLKCKLTPEEYKKYAGEKKGKDGKMEPDPDIPSIKKLQDGKEKKIEFTRWAGEMLEKIFVKKEKKKDLRLFEARLWVKLTGIKLAPKEQVGPFPGFDEDDEKED